MEDDNDMTMVVMTERIDRLVEALQIARHVINVQIEMEDFAWGNPSSDLIEARAKIDAVLP